MSPVTGLKGTYYVFWREMKRFLRQRPRIFMALFQPVVWLVLMGNMMARLTDNPYTAQMLETDNYLAFMTPGVMVMSSLFAGVFGGVSLIWDRRLGFLVKLLSAPIPRYSIALGKVCALMLQSMVQVSVIVIIASLLGVTFAAGAGGILLAVLLCALFVGIMSSVSLFLSASIHTPETLFAVINFLTMPLVFTSNAIFPTGAMPSWIQTMARFNPLSYAVSPIRTLVLEGWELSLLLPSLGVLLAMWAVALLLLFSRFERGKLL